MDLWFAPKKGFRHTAAGKEVEMKRKGRKGFLKKLFKYRVFLLMLLPSFIYMLVFHYYPMTGVVKMCIRDRSSVSFTAYAESSRENLKGTMVCLCHS